MTETGPMTGVLRVSLMLMELEVDVNRVTVATVDERDGVCTAGQHRPWLTYGDPADDGDRGGTDDRASCSSIMGTSPCRSE